MTKKHVWTCSPDTSIDDGNQQHADNVRPSIDLTSAHELLTLFSAHHICVCHQSASGLVFDQSIDTRSLAFAALESLVEHRITGLPVVDEDGKVVGVVSDYDMLTLDNVSGPMEKAGIFPTASMDWEAFHEVQKLILKNTGKLYVPSLVPAIDAVPGGGFLHVSGLFGVSQQGQPSLNCSLQFCSCVDAICVCVSPTCFMICIVF